MNKILILAVGICALIYGVSFAEDQGEDFVGPPAPETLDSDFVGPPAPAGLTPVNNYDSLQSNTSPLPTNYSDYINNPTAGPISEDTFNNLQQTIAGTEPSLSLQQDFAGYWEQGFSLEDKVLIKATKQDMMIGGIWMPQGSERVFDKQEISSHYVEPLSYLLTAKQSDLQGLLAAREGTNSYSQVGSIVDLGSFVDNALSTNNSPVEMPLYKVYTIAEDFRGYRDVEIFRQGSPTGEAVGTNWILRPDLKPLLDKR